MRRVKVTKGSLGIYVLIDYDMAQPIVDALNAAPNKDEDAVRMLRLQLASIARNPPRWHNGRLA
jgi:hypothetical protein